jgi:hypothetical protein
MNRLSNEQEEWLFNSAIQALEAEIANTGFHFSLDASARMAYRQQIKVMSSQLRMEVALGRITWLQAAEQAQHMGRNYKRFRQQ